MLLVHSCLDYAFGSYGRGLKVKSLFAHSLVSKELTAETVNYFISAAFLWKKKDLPVSDIRENSDYSVKSSSSPIKLLVGDQVDTPDLPIFSFDSVASATGDFAEENKLGQGGFGTVYKVNQLKMNFRDNNIGYQKFALCAKTYVLCLDRETFQKEERLQ